MSIECKTSMREFDELTRQIVEIIRKEIINTLSYLGEQCNVRIRDRSASESWIDHTGNLRSSIGYSVFEHGRSVITSTFESVLGGSTGSANGKSYVESLASQFSNVYALVVVAGMSYADYVESIESKDVLASTETWTRSVIDRYMDMAKEKAIKKINKLLAK